MECTVANKKLIALSKVVNASIIDTYGDIGRLEQRTSHWVARGLRKLYNEVLPNVKHKVWLTVSQNTHTATLPLDFDEETFIGFLDSRWHKVPLKLNNQITDTINIVDVPCESACPKCGQDTNICNDLIITEDTEIVVIDDTPYNRTIVKKLYPNGDYWLETTNPVLNINTSQIEYPVKKEFIVNFSLKPCGCLDTTPLNTANLITFCPDVYCNYFAPCDCQCNLSYGYKIFEESGLIQLDQNYPYDKLYVEYNGFISKIGGQYYVPMVAFETLVEYTKWKGIQNKLNTPNQTIELWRQSYVRERRNMERVLGRISLTQIIQANNLLPKFDIDFGYDYYSCFATLSSIDVPNTLANLAAANTINNNSGNGGTGSCSIINNNYITINNHAAYTLAVKVNGQPGEPVAGQSAYQNNVLIGASNVTYILLAKQVLTLMDGDFTINYTTGVIDISPNQFIFGDTLIVNYDKNT